jgi:2-polyprenyl-3-methyl-5-hydroxy-6-metoxy-1,4-benzoquinol methylase
MKHDSSTKSWSQLGREWFELAQTGESRMYFIMPYMLKKLGDVEGKTILDLGCGEGGYSRELAKNNQQSMDCLLNIMSETVTIYMALTTVSLILYFVL